MYREASYKAILYSVFHLFAGQLILVFAFASIYGQAFGEGWL